MSKFDPHHKTPTFTLEQSARLRQHLRGLWTELGTQRKAAELLSVDPGVLCTIFAGGHVPRRVAVRLAEHRGTTVDELIGDGS